MRQAEKAGGGYLAEDVEATLRRLIEQGEYAIGEKLPTVSALCERYGVSRTVVREAIAGLRAAGLVKSRRGSGVFVLSQSAEASVDTLFGGDWPTRVPELVDALELRAAVEIQSVSLAASRASNGQLEEIIEAHNVFISKVERREDASAEDFAFHAAIARATNNRYFENFLSEMGKRTIPRGNLSPASESQAYHDYMQQLAAEHELIMAALEARDPEMAAEAMRKHLLGSLARYRKASRVAKN